MRRVEVSLATEIRSQKNAMEKMQKSKMFVFFAFFVFCVFCMFLHFCSIYFRIVCIFSFGILCILFFLPFGFVFAFFCNFFILISHFLRFRSDFVFFAIFSHFPLHAFCVSDFLLVYRAHLTSTTSIAAHREPRRQDGK